VRRILAIVLLALGAAVLTVGPASAATSPTIDTSVVALGSGNPGPYCTSTPSAPDCYFTYLLEGSTTGPEPSGIGVANFTMYISIDPYGSTSSWCQIDLGSGTANWVEAGTNTTCIVDYTNALLGEGTLTANLPITIATGAYAPLLGGTLSFSAKFLMMTTGASSLYPVSELSLDLFNAGPATLEGTMTATPPGG
jgi:hypothetical protein